MRIGSVKSNTPFIKPDFPDPLLIAEDIRAIVASNWFTNFGPFERTFRTKIEEYLGPGVFATTVSSATAGLDIAVSALFQRDAGRLEVLVPSFTFAAGPEVLINHGFVPVFIDIDSINLQPSISHAKEYAAANHRALAGILLCNTFGVGGPDIDAWEALAREYELPLIIDSAAGFGSRYVDGQRVGSRGDCEVFSFHATKPFSVGEGGAVTTKNEMLQQQLLQLENFGFDDDKNVRFIGTNAKMQEICCAIGLRQFEHFDDRLSNRQNNLARYKAGLLPNGFTFQSNDETSSVPYVSALAPNGEWAASATHRLQAENIGARKYYTPLHLQPEIMKYSKSASTLDNTEDVFSRILALPLHDDMDGEVIDAITAIMLKAEG